MSGQRALKQVEDRKRATGLVIFRASRLEALLPTLMELMKAMPPEHTLAPQTLIAAHPGIQQWLNGALAKEYGVDGIAANLDITLPSAWIDKLALQLLGQRAMSLPSYQRQHLRWTIHGMLSGDIEALGLTDARVTKYLKTASQEGSAADAARRRFQLAERLAALFSQYLVYRPDWLEMWEGKRSGLVVPAGSDAALISTEMELLAPLWKNVTRALGAHRGHIVTELVAMLEKPDDVPAGPQAALHFFGISHLAPSELAVLRAFARHRLVVLYVPDPCQKYWAGLSPDLSLLLQRRDDEEKEIKEANGSDYWVEQEHPLLARWGRLGQHFIMALADADVRGDVRHRLDEQFNEPTDRLSRIQESIRQLDLGLMESRGEDGTDDASLLVHSCHTPLRELEVLRDQLLDALAKDESLKPSDIVVMAPDIQAYVPLIASVFGAKGNAPSLGYEPGSKEWDKNLPYHLADVAVVRSHSLLGAFQRLLDLPASRVTAPEVMDLLAVPEVARRLNLDATAVEELGDWLQRSRVAWALDPEFRGRFGVPAIAPHTFGWAMDRMLGGYIMADAMTDELQPSVTLPDSTELAPMTGIHGPAASHLGALDQLLGELQNLMSLAGKTMPPTDWANELETRFNALFRVDLMDHEAREAQAIALRLIRSVGTEPEAAGQAEELHFAVVRDLLMSRLSAAPERQNFLMGGVTFCGMVPQRAIPFKVVAVLGLNDGEFPRAVSDSGLDLMTRFRKLGDRDVRLDDRYLFLETLMSARTRLHLSYIGERVRDGKSCPPAAPLAELLTALDAAAGLRADDETASRPWCVRHPLQAFDGRYFDKTDPRLFSYSPEFAAMHGEGRDASVPAFWQSDVTTTPEAGSEMVKQTPVTLRDLTTYYKDPARHLLKDHLHISLDALDESRLPESEPLDSRFAAIDTVTKKLFFNEALLDGAWPPEEAPAWLRLSGLMPSGRLGAQAWQDEVDGVSALLEETEKLPGFESDVPESSSHVIDLEVGEQRITGQVEQVFQTRVGEVPVWQMIRVTSVSKGKLKKETDLNFKDRVPAFLDWALLRLQTVRDSLSPTPQLKLRVVVNPETTRWQDGINEWDDTFVGSVGSTREALLADLEKRVERLVGWFRKAKITPNMYFPKTAYGTLSRKDGEAPTGWISSRYSKGERDYSPGFSRLLAGNIEFGSNTAELRDLHEFAERLNECISFESNDTGDGT